ncbi:hypothetical protein B0H19DRAFT_1089872 [Mycena capillaripes]|nr:hypothetical protein B0H19DRAFT_1089872 [Mycena capillaripes]
MSGPSSQPRPNAWAIPLQTRLASKATPAAVRIQRHDGPPVSAPILPPVHQPPSSAPSQHVVTPAVRQPQRPIEPVFYRAIIVDTDYRPSIGDQGAREIRNVEARLALMKTETYDEARCRVHWEAVVCAIEALDIDSWTRNLAAVKPLKPQRWYEWSDVRAAAAQGRAGSEDAKRLIARNPQYIQDAYATLEEERLKLGEYFVSLIFDHPFITIRFMSSVCSRLRIAGEARRVILLTKNSDGDPIFRDNGVWEEEEGEEDEQAGIVPIVTKSAFVAALA